jgi:fimbrial isopeptide formation D2 family protein/LPXTG-motif cell wall-anchored protein
MKKTKRIAAMIAALAMMATMAVPFTMTASAAEVNVKVQTDGTLTNNDGENPRPDADGISHTYTAYEIFKGENVWTSTDSTDSSIGEFKFNITGLGGGVNWSTTDGLLKDGSDFMNLKPDGNKTIAQVIAALGTGATDAQKAAAIARVIGDNIATGSPEADELAKIFEKAKTGEGTKIPTDGVRMAEGYYLVTDSYTDGANNDAVSKFILQVAKNDDKTGNVKDIVIVPKKSYPTVEKKVKEDDKTVTGTPINDTNTTEKWNDVADYDIGEAVPFKLYGTMPATLADYKAYYYKFTDNLGTQFDQPTTITINVEDTTLTATWNSATSEYTVADDTGTNCRVAWKDNTLTIDFENIKAYTGVTTSTVVTVEYTAVLNANANIGLPGQENAVNLTYSNNPNFEYKPNINDDKPDVPKDDNGTPDDTTDDKEKTDKTPDDKVIVFTYELDVNKIDGTTKGNLPGAVFNLKKGTKFAKVDSNGKFLAWVDAAVTDAQGTTSLTSDANGLFTVSGIDEGAYSLVEVTPPTGYNPLTAPITVTISATTENNQAWAFEPTSALTEIKLNDEVQDEGTTDGKRGHVALEVENNKGTELPSTGGMGTILFYTVGGIMVVGAGVVLVTKKRSKNEQ